VTHATKERRKSHRHRSLEQHGIVSARVRPGHRARLIDVSAGGALIETSHRLLPGAVVELHVERQSEYTRVRGRVLRCTVVRVRPTWVCYRGAIGFERHLPWLLDDGACPARPADARSAMPERAPVTPEVM
jgi:PilZ domain-containing protein